MKRRAVVVVLALLFVSWMVAAQEGAEEKAVDAARAWLALVDEGSWAQSWNRAAELFRDKVSLEQWQSAMENGRAPLGRVLSREVKLTRHLTSLPDAPDGEYVIIQFETTFDKRGTVVETVTLKGEAGGWRVSGYYLR